MDSITFLADVTRPGGKRTALLKLDGAPQTVRSTVMHSSDGEPMLLLRVWLDKPVGYVYLVVDMWGRVSAEATGPRDEDVYPLIRERLAAKGIQVEDESTEYSLLADHVQNGKRTSVLRSDDDSLRVRAKWMYDENEELIHIRAEFTAFGFVHLVVDRSARLCVKATGKTDSDAWQRVEGELNRMEYAVI